MKLLKKNLRIIDVKENQMKKVSKGMSCLVAVIGILFFGYVGGGAAEKKQEKDLLAQRLKTFDQLDFEYYSNQKWDHFNESHTDDVVVVWPDGRETKGLKAHLEDLKFQFTFAPDTSIKVHPVKFGSSDW